MGISPSKELWEEGRLVRALGSTVQRGVQKPSHADDQSQCRADSEDADALFCYRVGRLRGLREQ